MTALVLAYAACGAAFLAYLLVCTTAEFREGISVLPARERAVAWLFLVVASIVISAAWPASALWHAVRHLERESSP